MTSCLHSEWGVPVHVFDVNNLGVKIFDVIIFGVKIFDVIIFGVL